MKISHIRGIIVGCAGAGKTTLLMRLQDMPYKELEEIKTTEIVDVHVNSFKVLEKLTTIKGKLHIYVIHTTVLYYDLILSEDLLHSYFVLLYFFNFKIEK